MRLLKILKNGIINENPILVQLIGMCSVLAVSNTALNSLAMSGAVLAVLIGSNVVISLLRGFIPEKIRIPIFVVVIATFVTMVEMFIRAYSPAIYQSLGIFIPLIVVNCLILARAESFAYKNGIVSSIVDALGQGLGYTVAIVVLGTLRELIGSGSVFGLSVFGESFQPAAIFVAPPGAFILLGILIAIFNTMIKKKATN